VGEEVTEVTLKIHLYRGSIETYLFIRNDYEKWNCFIIPYLRVSKYLQMKKYSERLLSILHVIQNKNLRRVNPGTALKCHLILTMRR